MCPDSANDPPSSRSDSSTATRTLDCLCLGLELLPISTAPFPAPPFNEPLLQQYFPSPHPAHFQQQVISNVSFSSGESISENETSSLLLAGSSSYPAPLQEQLLWKIKATEVNYDSLYPGTAASPQTSCVFLVFAAPKPLPFQTSKHQAQKCKLL